MTRIIYLDHNATTPLSSSVKNAMERFGSDAFGNPSSRHALGRNAWNALEHAREQVATWAHAHPDDILFCSGATEANFLALTGRFLHVLSEGKQPNEIRVAVSTIEHPCVLSCMEWMQDQGADVHSVPVGRNGVIDTSFFDDSNWDIVSVMAANHETGAIQPIREISSRLDPARTFFHTDGAQWCGRFEGGLEPWNAGAMTVSAHKMYGPKGIGALIRKQGISITPMMPGSQEAGMRSGTVNVPAAVGFGQAAEDNCQNRIEENQSVSRARDHFWESLSASVKDISKTIENEHAISNTLHVRFHGIKGERVVDSLDRLGIACSSGPACASGASEASSVLRAMEWDEQACWEGVRFSLGHQTTLEDLDEATRRIAEWHSSQIRCIA